MIRVIRARAKQGMFEPLEPITVPDGTEVTVTIPESRSAEDLEIFRSSETPRMMMLSKKG